MKLSQGVNLQLSQKLTLSHEMLQSLELIQLPILELKERIEQEVLENPALEMIEKPKNDDSQNLDKIEETFNVKDNYFEDSSSAEIDTGYSGTSSPLDLKRQFLEGAISRSETLHDKLLWQLRLLEIDEKKKEIGETIIRFIDENGFFKEELEELFKENSEEAREVLELIQNFDPPGIASKGIREALLYQLESLTEDRFNELAYIIIRDHFDTMLARRDSQLAKELKVKSSELKEAFEFLGHFEPYPGRVYDSSRVDYITPDAFIYRADNELVVEINEDILPSLTVSGYMQKISEEVKRKKKLTEQKKYISEKVNNAKKFINIIKHRHQSLFRVVLAIVKFQEKFFHKGPKSLVPLTMKQVGEEVGLAESTISRLASSKFIQTEWGIHEIKYFFTNSVGSQSEGGDVKSAEGVREMIKEIIEANEGKKISDQKIADILKNRGITIARRTVAKYRKMLNILPSHQRAL